MRLHVHIEHKQSNYRTTANAGFRLVCMDTQIRKEIGVDRA